jgi:hypothetical protein
MRDTAWTRDFGSSLDFPMSSTRRPDVTTAYYGAPAIAKPRTRKLTIVAQDPAVRDARGRILTAEVDVPAEQLARGPLGYRVHVIDYDGSTRTLYEPLEYTRRADGVYRDPFRNLSDTTILNDPKFHAQNVYAIVMRTLARFEFALGRRISWGFSGHQLNIAPHAFADAYAFYSEEDQALMFGYFPGSSGMVFSCLSHDVVAHETTHALIDGLRGRFTDPSSPDQAAFHEGFADVVALLSVFSLRAVVMAVLDRTMSGPATRDDRDGQLVHEAALTPEALRQSLLFGLAEEMGQEMASVRGEALRRSVSLSPSPEHITSEEFQEPHRRGEILVAAMMNAFIAVLVERLKGLGRIDRTFLDRARVAEEAAESADYLLTMSIRALDYAPPVHIEFPDFLSALVTADHEIRPDDSKYKFRKHLVTSFRRYGIRPSPGSSVPEGLWLTPPQDRIVYDRTHFESMTRDPDEVFRFVWENRATIGLSAGAFARILSVRPCLRIAPDDGFPLRETVAECMEQVKVAASDLVTFGITKPAGMPDDQEVSLEGGFTLIFDEYGRLKFVIAKRLFDRTRPEVQQRQSARLADLWRYGHYRRGASLTRRFSAMHRQRSLGLSRTFSEEW